MFAPKQPPVLRRLSTRRTYGLILSVALAAALAYVLQSSGTKASAARAEDGNPPAAVSSKSKELTYVPGEVLVRFRAEAKAADAEKSGLALRDSVGNEMPVRFERPEGLEIVRGLRVAHVGEGETLRAVALLRARPDVVYAEPNYVRRKLAAPNDPRYTEQWNMRGGPPGATAGAHAEAAWDVTTGSRSVVVGVIDEGIDTNHQDLQANIWRNPGEVANNGLDDDNNGYADDINGWDFFHNDKSVYDNPSNVSGVNAPDAHGTHVAGIVGAVGNNAVGVAGVNWQVSLMSLKILGAEGEGPAPASVLETVRAYAYAKRMRELFQSSGGSAGANVRVLNNSYGGFGRSQAELDAINELASVGILFVAASGNDSENNEQLPSYPGGYDTPNLINVAASDQGDGVAFLSNYSPRSVHMSAPGVSVLSTTPGNTYNYASGTSMASPHVAGAAALICAARPDISVAGLRAALLFGGDPIASHAGKTVTGRRLNVTSSLQLAQSADASAPTLTDVSVVAQDGRSVTLAWTAPGDDGNAGQASLYEIRFVGQSPGEQFRLAAFRPAAAGARQSATVKIPYRHTSGALRLQAFDDAGNVATASVPVTVDDLSANPYTVTTGPPTPLTTGGTPLHVNFDDFHSTYFMPFAFPYFEGFAGAQQVTATSNGALFFGFLPQNDALSYVGRLEGWRMIAGLWDDLDLRTCFRPDADIYATQETDRVVFRWQGVRFQSAQCPASPAGRAVNFEVELRRDGTIIKRYGDGNQRVFPVVGISDAEPSAYVAATHTSEFEPVDLTNAQTITYTLRRPPPRADVRISEYPFNYYYPVRVNDEFEVPVAVTNAGPDKAAGVRLTTTPPFQNQAVLVSCSASQGVCSAGEGGTAVVDFGGLASGATARATLTFKAVTVGNGFSIGHRVTSNTYDPSSSDNEATTIINIWEGNPNPLTGVTSVSGGGSHSLAVKPDGTVLAWGQNFAGQLGDGGFVFYAERAQSVPNLTGVASVAAGASHSLAVKTTGAVWSWGENSSGQLGDGTTTARKRPAKIPNLTGVVAAAASLHSLALKGDGTVWAWGANASGQLGDGTTAARSTPAQVSNLSGVKAVDAGSNFSVALKTDGTVWAWGANNLGQLGDGTDAQRTAPVKVAGLSDVTAVAAGSGHAVALKSDGTVWAWGANNFGQLGDGTTTLRTSPVQVQGLSGVVSVACGDYTTLARKADGTVWSWGANFGGALGDGTNTQQRNSPVKAVNMKNALAIAAGGQHSFALTAGGTVWTWGDNTYGQLGSGSTSSRPWAYEAMAPRPEPQPIGVVSAPTFTPSGGSSGGAQSVGVHVAGDDLKVNAAAIGGSTSLAIASDGALYAWGNNGYGQAGVEPLALGPFNSIQALPRAVQLTGVVSAAAHNANAYALKSDGTVWAWGIGFGLGTGTADGAAHPTPVQVNSLAGVKEIATGAGHVVALKTDGTVWTWGANNNGQLGDGTTAEFRNSPVQVSNLTGVVSVAAAFNNTYVLKGDGTVWAWGYNGGGQAGDGSTVNQRNSPVQVAGLTNVKSVFGGYACGLAVRTDGTLWGWGTINNIYIPNAHPVEGLTNVRMAATGNDFAAVLKEDGTVWTWGSNSRGLLGNGQLGGPPFGGRVDTPTKVEALSGVTWLAVSEGYTSDGYVAALKGDGSLWMWGSNVLGQLGDASVLARYLPAPVESLSGNILVYYTTDGREPTQDDEFLRAGGSLTIDHSVTLKARAFRDGWTPSGVTSASFVVSGNSIDGTPFFVRQHYLDFLNREPDASGLAFWTQNIDSCDNLQCREVKRINTSAAFFLSIEFQETGFLVYRMNKAAFGDLPGKPVPVRRAELLADMQLIGQGVVVGQGNWREQLETNKQAFAAAFVQRQRFTDAYPASMSAAEFVAKLNANTGGALTSEQANDIAQEFAAGGNTVAARGAALRKVSENAEVSRREKNRAFVLMQYFGYLRRDPDEAPEATLDYGGFNFWLSKLNQFNGDFVKAEMVKAFLDSTEYRKRFGQ